MKDVGRGLGDLFDVFLVCWFDPPKGNLFVVSETYRTVRLVSKETQTDRLSDRE